MLKQCKKILGALVLAIVLLPVTVSHAEAQTGIRSYDMGHYQHAKEVLSQENPKFLTQFQTLRKEIKLIDSSDKQAQYTALMRFFTYLPPPLCLFRCARWLAWSLPTERIMMTRRALRLAFAQP